MKKSNPSSTRQGMVFLILLFLLASMVILLGYFIFKKPVENRRQLAAISMERPSIHRPGVEEPSQEALQSIPQETQQPQVEETNPTPVDNQTRDIRLFFYKLDDQGQITLKSVLRPIPKNQFTLEEAVGQLLDGPSSSDLDKHYLSLIPQGSRLNEVRIVSDTARLDFSEEFSFNSLGYEGFNAQLKQIVYTATEFNQIDQVLFTIDGELREYINGEGIYTGEPLDRESF